MLRNTSSSFPSSVRTSSTCQQLAASNSATTTREKAYIDALATVYVEDGKTAPSYDQAFEKIMRGALAAHAL